MEIKVVGAAIVRDGLILCAQRGPEQSLPGMWEFPGGKIEPGESPEEALRREVREELDCSVQIEHRLNTHTEKYSFASVTLTVFLCHVTDGTPRPTEHSNLRWTSPERLDQLEWAPADIPAVREIQKQYSSDMGSECR